MSLCSWSLQTHLQVLWEPCPYIFGCPSEVASAKINFSYSILFHLATSYSSYFGGKKGISRNKTSFFLLMGFLFRSLPCFSLFGLGPQLLELRQPLCMTNCLQWDSRGCFTRTTLTPSKEASTPMPQPSLCRPNHLQRLIVAAATLLTSDIPFTEFINNISMAYYVPSPENSLSTSSSPILMIPPCIPQPNFDRPGSDNSDPAAALNMAFSLDNTNPPPFAQNPEAEFLGDHQASSQPLPSIYAQTPFLPSCHTRFLPITPSHLALLLPPTPLAPNPVPPKSMMSHASGPAAMPSA